MDLAQTSLYVLLACGLLFMICISAAGGRGKSAETFGAIAWFIRWVMLIDSVVFLIAFFMKGR